MRKVLIIFGLILLQYGCSSNNDSDTMETDVLNDPSSARLIFPHENSLCNEGTNITDTESTVLFEWWASNNTDSYNLTLKNLTTGVISNYPTTSNEIPIVLTRATPYEWYVISESNQVVTTAQSSIWQFYNAGEGIQTYPPFPAEISSPEMAETIITEESEISLVWIGHDLDEDIIGFDIYFGTDNPPAILISDLVESTLIVPISSATIYYWYVITKDAEGNNSNSGIYQFRIQ